MVVVVVVATSFTCRRISSSNCSKTNSRCIRNSISSFTSRRISSSNCIKTNSSGIPNCISSSISRSCSSYRITRML